MSNKHLTPIERFTGAFLQSLWVGGIWISLLVIFPALGQTILAPILVHDVVAHVEPRVVFVILICVICQLFLFLKINSYRMLFNSAMGIGLILVFLLSGIFLVLDYLHLFGYRLRGMLYIMLALLGLFLTFHLPPWLQKQIETD